MSFRLCLLGEIDLRDQQGRVLESLLAQPKRLALLAYLATARPRGLHRRDELLALLWPDHDQERARASLRQSLHAIRLSLGRDVLHTPRDGAGLTTAEFSCDVWEFEAACEAGRQRDAVALYHGEFLHGFFASAAAEFEHWVDGERARLARMYATALERLAEGTSPADPLAAVEWWRRLSEYDPYSGRIALGLMTALESAGDASAAILHAERYTALLHAELGAEADPEVLQLAERMRKHPTATPAREPPVRTAATSSSPRPLAAAPSRWPRRVRLTGFALLVLAAVLGAWRVRDRMVEASPLSLAVLPFTAAGDDPQSRLLAAALTEAMLKNLGAIDELRVVRGAAHAPGIAAPGADGLAEQPRASRFLEATVTRTDEEFRIQLRLHRGDVTSPVLERTFHAAAGNVLSLDSQLTWAVARALDVRVRAEVRARIANPPTRSLAAYDAYARGIVALNDWNAGAIDSAIAAFEQAVRHDSTFALARALLADAYLEKMDIIAARPEYLARAWRMVETALFIDPALAEGYVARGDLLWNAANGFPHDRAIREVQRAIELEPSLARAHHRLCVIYTHVGLLELALKEGRTAESLDPLDHWARFHVGFAYALQQRYREAQAELEKLPPQVAPMLRAALSGEALLYLGEDARALRLLDSAVVRFAQDPWVRAMRGLARARAGNRPGADADIAAANELAATLSHGHHADFTNGLAAAVMGRNEEAVRWLRRAAARGWHAYPRYARDPWLRPLQRDPAFAALLAELRTAWLARAQRYGEPVTAAD